MLHLWIWMGVVQDYFDLFNVQMQYDVHLKYTKQLL